MRVDDHNVGSYIFESYSILRLRINPVIMGISVYDTKQQEHVTKRGKKNCSSPETLIIVICPCLLQYIFSVTKLFGAFLSHFSIVKKLVKSCREVQTHFW